MSFFLGHKQSLCPKKKKANNKKRLTKKAAVDYANVIFKFLN